MKNKLSVHAVIFAVLMLSYLTTCTRDTLFNKDESVEPVTCAAFFTNGVVADSLVDTTGLLLIDTVHSFDTISFIGMISPPNSPVSPSWVFGDDSVAETAVARHAYAQGGTYNAIFTITDQAGFWNSDTVTVIVNTPPDRPVLHQPDTLKSQNVQAPIYFSWSCADADADSLLYTVRIDTIAPPRVSYATSDTDLTLPQGQLIAGRTYYWEVIATDRFGDSGKSPASWFSTTDSLTATFGEITGTVVREGGISPAGIDVLALNGQTFTGRTDSAGNFRIRNIPQGDVTVIIFDTTSFAPETLYVTVEAGRKTTLPAAVLRDNTPPVFTINVPSKVHVGADFHLLVSARDTLYGVDSIQINTGSGFVRLDTSDTLLRIDSTGFLTIILRAFDINGNSGVDTVFVKGNAAPGTPVLRSPLSFADLRVGALADFSWSCTDPDDTLLRYDVLIKKSRSELDTAAPRFANQTGTSNQSWTPEQADAGLYYWKVRAFDAFDTVASAVDSFRISDGSGAVTGKVRRQGLGETGNDSIAVEAFKGTVSLGIVRTAANGSFAFYGLRDTVKLVSRDYGFAPESTTVIVVNGISVSATAMVLRDTLAPVISKSGDTVIRAGGDAAVHIDARDTCYTVDSLSADFGSGFRTITNPIDTTVSYSVYGDNKIRIRAVDANMNVRVDSITVHVNRPPGIPRLVSPGSYAGLDVGSNVNMVWTCRDSDNTTLHYDVFMAKSPAAINMSAPLDTNKADTLYSWLPDVADAGLYFWKIRAFDAFDTVVSVIDSFRVSQGTGSVAGVVRRQGRNGTTGNDSIMVFSLKNGSTSATVKSAANGSYMITGLSDTLKIIATDYGFKPDTTLVVVVNGVTTHADTLTLLDTLAPWITRTGASVIKSGGSSSLHIAARDTFYTTDTLQADFGAGYRTITNPLDTSVSYSSYGDHFVRIRAVDVNGNVRRDSTNVHVNLPPNVPVRVWPSVGQKIEINTPVSFYWNGGDPDNAANVRYDLFVGTSRTISAANRVAQAINDTSYLSIWNSGESRIPYFWRVAASDGYDTTWSTVDSFNVGKYTSTRIYGYARLEGVQRHNGIKVTLTGLQTYSVQTDSLGSVSIEVNPGTYTITAADTLRGVFSTATGSATGNANDSATFGTIVLHDSDNPVIACSSPAQNAALTSLNPRTITVTGTFSDVGSQVHVDSVRATLNGVPVTGLIKSSSAWQFTMSNVADGHYTVRVDAADSAGNSATQLVRAFTVNSKSISALKRFHHDTMYCTASVANVLPPIRAYYWNFRSHASSAWSDSSITSADTAAKTFPWPASFSNGPDTLIVMAVDDSGMAVYDTVPYTVSADTPVASAGADTVLAMGTSSSPLLLHGSYEQQFGHAARFDWSINNGGSSFTRTSTPDTTVNFSASYSAGIMCVFKVTDDAAVPNVSYDTMYVGIGRTWTPVGAADITTSSTSYTNFSLGVYSDNEMYLALSDASTWKIKVMKWDGSSWATVGSGFSTGSADRMQVAIGTGFGYGGAQYSVPYVGFWDGGASRVRVCKPTGDTVGAQSLCAGKFHSYFRLAIPTGGGTSTVYLADNDSLSANRVKVRKYYSGVYNWDSIAVSGGPSGPSVRDFSTDGTAYYLLTHTSSADTLKKLNGSVWQTVGSYTNANHPVLYCAGSSSLYMADQDGSYSNRLTVKQYNGSSWSLVGGAPVSKNTVWNTTFATMGSIALQATGGYPCVAYPEVDDDNLNDTLRVKAFDGTSWRTVGVEGLPITGISINKASFCVKNGRMYLACRNSSTSQITVYQLR